jgi:hypothetical protein
MILVDFANNLLAQKSYRCDRCGGEIPPKTRYVSAFWSGTKYRYCEPCYWHHGPTGRKEFRPGERAIWRRSNKSTRARLAREIEVEILYVDKWARVRLPNGTERNVDPDNLKKRE